MLKIKNTALDQYGAETFEQQQFGTAGVQRVNNNTNKKILNELETNEKKKKLSWSSISF